MHLKCRPQSDGHFVSASMCQSTSSIETLDLVSSPLVWKNLRLMVTLKHWHLYLLYNFIAIKLILYKANEQHILSHSVLSCFRPSIHKADTVLLVGDSHYNPETVQRPSQIYDGIHVPGRRHLLVIKVLRPEWMFPVMPWQISLSATSVTCLIM